MMKPVSAQELRTMDGGKSATCSYCGTTFKDTKVLSIVIKTGDRKLFQHYSMCRQYKKVLYGY